MVSFHQWCVDHETLVRILYDSLLHSYTLDDVRDHRLKTRCPHCAEEGSRVAHLQGHVFDMVQYLNQIQAAKNYRGWETDLKDFAKNMGGSGPEKIGTGNYYSSPPIDASGGVSIGGAVGVAHGVFSAFRDLGYQKNRKGQWEAMKKKEDADVATLKKSGSEVYQELVKAFYEVVSISAANKAVADRLGDGVGSIFRSGGGLTDYIGMKLYGTLEHWCPIYRERLGRP